tara:strand:- start:178 stop:1110 length:933 start_codon:yes stop_codon:yes gene_type:complete
MRILVTGGTGMLGSCFDKLKTEHQIITIGRKDADLTDESQFSKIVKEIKPDSVIHLAAKVGGVKSNAENVGTFYRENIQINTSVLNVCLDEKVRKVVSLLSTCVYPDDASYPLTEDQIHKGPPHHSNFGYAYAKRMLDVQSRAFRSQFGCDFVCAVPNNLYGPNDNFHLEDSHVIPAIIRKIYTAKTTNKKPVFWGDGSPLREFTYSHDIAKVLVFLAENYSSEKPINIGNVGEYSIKNVVNIISDILDYKGEALWDSELPNGQYRKPSCNKNLLSLGWSVENYTSIREGLEMTCNWFLENQPNVRGMSK